MMEMEGWILPNDQGCRTIDCTFAFQIKAKKVPPKQGLSFRLWILYLLYFHQIRFPSDPYCLPKLDWKLKSKECLWQRTAHCWKFEKIAEETSAGHFDLGLITSAWELLIQVAVICEITIKK